MDQCEDWYSTFTFNATHNSSGEIQNIDREIKKCLVDAFKKTDEDFLQRASAATPSWKDGSTVAAVLVLDDTVYSANLGDSKAVLCRKVAGEGRTKGNRLSFVPLTKDHNPTNVSQLMSATLPL